MDVSAISDNVLDILQVIGTIAFAASGALAAGKKGMDWFGVVVLAVMVSVGGGSLRDMLLGLTPVFWVESPWYVLVAAFTAMVIIPITRLQFNYQNYLSLSDAIGLAVFAVLGTQTALAQGVNGFVAIIMGVVTGVFGGVLRDVLANAKPSILYGDIYALAAMAGCTAFVLLLNTAVPPLYSLWISIGIVFVLRLFAIYRDWSLPNVDLENET